MTREVMLVGSVPLKPAMSVFKCACDHGLKPLLPRIPDGEQRGWNTTMLSWRHHPALEATGELLPLTRRPTPLEIFGTPLPLFRLKAGHTAEELMIEDMGIARGFEQSYAEFKKAKAEGIIAPQTRFAATIAGPGTATLLLDVPDAEFFPVLNRMYRNEIARMVELAPPEELAIQIDLAAEVELEEYRRRPEAWDMPLPARQAHHYLFEEASTLIGEIASTVPEPVQLGFHLCATYHVDPTQGQDLNVHVEWANALTRKVRRPIDFMHIPTTQDHGVKDFEPLRHLQLYPRTKLYLGLIHAPDGVKGAVRRIKAAAQVRPDFGIAAFCGLAQYSLPERGNPLSAADMFEIHRAAAVAT